MNARKDSTATAERKQTFFDLEDGLNHTYRFAMILADMIEDTLAYNQGERIGDSSHYKFYLDRDQLENLAFMSVQAQSAAEKVKGQFYEIAHSGRAS